MLELKNIGKIYHAGDQEFLALRDVSLKVETGEFMAFVGPSGSGKTTLLNLIGGLDRPTSGDIILDGINFSDKSRDELSFLRRKYFGFVFQSHNLLPVYSVYENVLFPLLLNGEKELEVRDKIMGLVEQVGLGPEAHKKPHELSGGQCQRAAIARALVKRPKLILADEPTANLDAENSYNILELMLDLNRKYGAAFIFSTHDEKVTRYLKREVRLEDGRIVWDREKE